MSTPEEAPIDDLAAFINAAPSPYHAASEVADRLEAAGFTRLTSGEQPPGDGPVVVRNAGLVVAVGRTGQPAAAPFRVVAAHTDSPNLRVRPRPDQHAAGWRQLGVEVYGGALLNSWLDRDLGLSGRVALDVGTGVPELREVRWDRPLLRVPQLAIHLDRDVSSVGLKLDKQAHLTPIWGLGTSTEGDFRDWLAAELSVGAADVLAWDLMGHDLTAPARLGRDEELFAASRLDNLCSSWAGTVALANVLGAPTAGTPDAVPVVVLSDHEEVGSTSGVGAASALVERVLAASVRAAGGDRAELDRALAGTLVASADMAHATHPNYADRHEPQHPIAAGGGVALKVNSNQRYGSDARTVGAALLASRRADVEVQTYSHHGALPCGSTVGPILGASLGVGVVDVGAPQLSMHSARELMAVADVEAYRRFLSAWLGGPARA
ncbi:MAG: M18 family aminopeptidase [Microthrixaceae bacterium]